MTDFLAWPRAVLTLEDWEALPDEVHRRCELVEGTLLVTTSPALGHQRVLRRLLRRLEDALPDGLEVLPGTELLCDAGPPATVRRPDLAVFRAGLPDRMPHLLPPDVVGVVEVLSPGTRRTDRVAKVYDYAEAGVGWYLVVDPDCAAMTLFVLPADGTGPYDCAERDEPVVELPGVGAVSLG
ncbi:Uma2 family endonuclease [Actinomycetospora termitidis]|uniref:Uma2 family endonuclease n=1 Tax=Actinomycetospora termitidis TaxID=3053470 RepID=A0ABT7M951_9PSEU|nr:Uma2 family endonuclease [Actinomycetospora sp. Odt1-22]MDL5157200.1 Uma2 family endonuclease [Actinomycetospora sp. Odt1-22]